MSELRFSHTNGSIEINIFYTPKYDYLYDQFLIIKYFVFYVYWNDILKLYIGIPQNVFYLVVFISFPKIFQNCFYYLHIYWLLPIILFLSHKYVFIFDGIKLSQV